MGKLLALDIGKKRTGIAVTDALQICASGLPTVLTAYLLEFLKEYCTTNSIDAFIVGEPKDLKGAQSESMKFIKPLTGKIKKEFPDIPIVMYDERFTSSIAHREMIAAGFKKKQRQEKGKADEMAAIIILNSYLESRQFLNRQDNIQ